MITDVTLEQQKSFASRKVDVKVETLVLLLTKRFLSIKTLEKHIEKIEEYKGKGLFANNLDTGNLLKI